MLSCLVCFWNNCIDLLVLLLEHQLQAKKTARNDKRAPQTLKMHEAKAEADTQPRAVKCLAQLDNAQNHTKSHLEYQSQAHRASIGFCANLATIVYELAVSRTLMSAHVG